MLRFPVLSFMVASQGYAVIPSFISSTATSGNATSFTFSHNPDSAANSILLLTIGVNTATNPAVSTVTFNGTSLTLKYNANFSGQTQNEVWYLLNPATFTANIIVTLGASAKAAMGATSYSGVNQTTPFGASTSATSNVLLVSLTLTTTTANSLIIVDPANQFTAAGVTSTSGMTERYAISTSGNPNSSNEHSCIADLSAPTTGKYNPTYLYLTNNNNILMFGFELVAAGNPDRQLKVRKNIKVNSWSR